MDSVSVKYTSYCQGKIERSGIPRLAEFFEFCVLPYPEFLLHIHASRATEYGVSNGLFLFVFERTFERVLTKLQNGPLTQELRTEFSSLHPPSEANC